MNICIPVEADRGLDSQVSTHFSRVSTFVVVDTDTLSTAVFERQTLGAETDAGQVLMISRKTALGRVVVSGIGPDALAELQDAGLDVYTSTMDTVREIVEACRQGTLTPITFGDSCKKAGRGFGGGMCGGAHGCGHC